MTTLDIGAMSLAPRLSLERAFGSACLSLGLGASKGSAPVVDTSLNQALFRNIR